MPRPEFAMPDHGLFVAGIVHSIAPDVELHLLRVLNDFGIGDQFALEQVMRSLPGVLLRDAPDARLIVNLSLGSAVPVPRRRYWDRWLPESRRRARDQRWPDERTNQLLDGAHQSLLNTVQWLHDQNVLVVAAAGNDGLRHHNQGEPPAPRYPAYYEPVLAVAASIEDGQPADYSNRGDVRPFGNGITTFGGQVVPSGRDQPPRTAAEGSMIGFASSGQLAGGDVNRTGWVRWAGTSFSSAIISGFAARLWQQDASQTPDRLMRRIRGCAHDVSRGRPPGNDPDGPLDAPYLDARQEPV
jgi:hypothetical protein